MERFAGDKKFAKYMYVVDPHMNVFALPYDRHSILHRPFDTRLVV